MEDYEYRVSNYMQLYPMNTSKFAGNISKTTSNFTSKTNQIRLGGGGHGGAYPLYASLSQTVCRPWVHQLGESHETLWRPVETLGGK